MDERLLPLDVPAAHSMDTTWYAVDADGNVAQLHSEEAGAVPVDAPAGISPAEPTFDVDLLLAAVVARALADGTYDSRPEPIDRPQRVLVVLAPSNTHEGTYRDAVGRTYPAQALLSKVGDVLVRDAEPRVVLTARPASPALVETLVARSDVKRVIGLGEASDYLHEGRVLPLFRFRHGGDEDPFLYVREGAPAEPLRIGDLPDTIRDVFASARVPVTFGDTNELVLTEHFQKDALEWWSKYDEEKDAAPPRPRAVVPPSDRAALLGLTAGIAVVAVFVWWIFR